MSYQHLCFVSTDFSLNSGITPHFFCPVCGYPFQATYSFGSNLPIPFDFNQLVSFPIPVHTSLKTGYQCILPYNTVKLYVAVHKDVNFTAFCIQRSNNEGAAGIPVYWWQIGALSRVVSMQVSIVQS